jgi:hypothetical protein
MHLDEEQVQRVLHGELPPPLEAAVHGHLATCSECRRRVGEAEREELEVAALLRHVDHPTPRVDAETVIADAGAHGVRWGRRAAGVLVALGLAGLSYALPGSPVPALVSTAVNWVDRLAARPAPPPPPSPAEVEPAEAGIAMTPGPELVILFTSARAEGSVRVSLTDDTQVVVRAPAGAARFTSLTDRLVIENAGPPAEFEIRIPRDARRVEIRVDGRRILLKERARIAADRPAEPAGHYLLPLTGPRP